MVWSPGKERKGEKERRKKKKLHILEGSDDCVVHLLEYDFYLIK
jgi:hypothetical protein